MRAIHADVLVIGGGFAGLSCFQAIDRKRRKVNLLTDRNHFLFTPLLPLAAVGTMEVRSIVEPLRSFEKNEGEIIVGKAFHIEPYEKKVSLQSQDRGIPELIHFEALVLAVGATTATFDIEGVKEHCLFLKEMKDARTLREKIIFQFEKAAHLEPDQASAALNFVIVGGGPTGVETACEIHDLVTRDLRKDFPRLFPFVQIQIIESGKGILSVFDKTLVRYAERKLKQKKIRVVSGIAVKAVEKTGLVLNDEKRIAADMIIWAAGNTAHTFTKSAAESLNLKLNDRGRIPVNGNLTTGTFENIYAIGDCAAVEDKKHRSLPATAQVAVKQGLFVGNVLSNKAQDRLFHFKSMGMLASLGSDSAIAEIGNLHFKGLLTMWFWKAAYLTRLVSLRNKLSVLFDWIKVKLFGRNTARIEFDNTDWTI